MRRRTGAQAPLAPARGQTYLLVTRQEGCYGLPAEIVRGLGAGTGSLATIDLLAHFPGTARAGRPSRVVRCGRLQVEHAVLVDEVLGLLECPREALRPLPALFTGSERVWFSGLFVHETRVVLAVNADWLSLGFQRGIVGGGALDPAMSPSGPEGGGGLLGGTQWEAADGVEDRPCADR